jgi:hypothetical protein
MADSQPMSHPTASMALLRTPRRIWWIAAWMAPVLGMVLLAQSLAPLEPHHPVLSVTMFGVMVCFAAGWLATFAVLVSVLLRRGGTTDLVGGLAANVAFATVIAIIMYTDALSERARHGRWARHRARSVAPASSTDAATVHPVAKEN